MADRYPSLQKVRPFSVRNLGLTDLQENGIVQHVVRKPHHLDLLLPLQYPRQLLPTARANCRLHTSRHIS